MGGVFELNVYIAKPEQSEPKFCYHKGDYASINNYLMGIHWVTALQGKTVGDIWKYLSTELKSAMDAHIPKSSPSKDRKRKLWMNRAVMAKQDKRTWLGNATQKLETLLATSELKEMTRNLSADFEHDLARNMKHNPNVVWKYSGTNLKAKSKLGDLLNCNGELTCDDTEKANIINSTFTSVFTRENTKKK